MSKDFEEIRAGLKQDILCMGEMAENAVDTAIMALIDKDHGLARQVIDNDGELDKLELAIDKECLNLLEVFHPEGEDLRFVAATLKINNDLERIGDLATEIAYHAAFLSDQQPVLKDTTLLAEMVERVERMIRESIQTLIDLDTDLARRICTEDDAVDEQHNGLINQLNSVMERTPSTVTRATRMLLVVRSLERIADQATNIAEEVIYVKEGRMIRHGMDTFPKLVPEEL